MPTFKRTEGSTRTRSPLSTYGRAMNEGRDPAAQCFGDAEACDDAVRAVEWELARAPDLSEYMVICETTFGPLRFLKTANSSAFLGVIVLFTHNATKVHLQGVRPLA